jgi:hypothetical protein
MLHTTSMSKKELPTDPVPLNIAARCLSVPAYWLRQEIESGRIPALVAGRAILVHTPTVAQMLTERAKREGGAK